MGDGEVYASDEVVAYDGDDVRLVMADRSPSDTLLTFSVRPQPRRPLVGFASRLARNNDLTGLYVIAKRPHWWQSPEMQEVQSRIVQSGLVSRATNSLAYGASMGAFGAMAYASRLGCRRALLIAPQVSVDPTIVPFEHRWDEDIESIGFLDSDGRSGIDESCSYTILFDPRILNDRMHVEMIPDAQHIDKIPIPFGGHTLPELLLQTGVIKEVVLSSLAGKLSAGALRQKMRRNRVNSSHYYDMLSRYALAHGKTVVAAAAADRWLELAPSSSYAFGRAIKTHRELGSLAMVEAVANTFTVNNPDNIRGWRALRQVMYEQGNFGGAIEAALRSVELSEQTADDFRWCVRINLRLNRKEEALDWYLKGANLFPNDVGLASFGAQAYRALGLNEEAAALESAAE